MFRTNLLVKKSNRHTIDIKMHSNFIEYRTEIVSKPLQNPTETTDWYKKGAIHNVPFRIISRQYSTT